MNQVVTIGVIVGIQPLFAGETTQIYIIGIVIMSRIDCSIAMHSYILPLYYPKMQICFYSQLDLSFVNSSR